MSIHTFFVKVNIAAYIFFICEDIGIQQFDLYNIILPNWKRPWSALEAIADPYNILQIK